MVCERATTIQADIMCVSELNLDTNQYTITNTMKQIHNKYFHHSRFAASTSSHRSARKFKPGGTAMLVIGNTTAPIKTMTRDRMGRWVATHLAGEDNSTITIITAYQVCQSTITGNNTAANQQISQIISENKTEGNLNPRHAFIHDLTNAIQQYIQRGDKIILVGDFNDPHNDDNGITDLAQNCGLADVFGLRLGTTTAPNTYQRSNKRLDFALHLRGWFMDVNIPDDNKPHLYSVITVICHMFTIYLENHNSFSLFYVTCKMRICVPKSYANNV
jgi:exonuclease III